MRSSSSDSDAGERVENVRSVLVKSKGSQLETDENYAYKRKLGDLIFNANFEAGNLGYVEQIDEYSYDLMVRPDVANPRYRLWFNFTVTNQRPNQCVVFTFVNFSDQLKLFHEGLTPVVRSRSTPNWSRLHEDQVFYYRSPHHGDRYVLSVAFRFMSYDNEHQFALFFPYVYSNLTTFVNRWVVELKRLNLNRETPNNEPTARLQHHYDRPSRRIRHKSPDLCRRQQQASKLRHLDDTKHQDEQALRTNSSLGMAPKKTTKSKHQQQLQLQLGRHAEFKVESIATSILSKPIYQLSVGDSAADTAGSSSSVIKPKVIVTCRPCGNLDGAASLVCQGLLDYMLSDSPIARVARHCIDLVAFPMLDPDCISAGNSRSDILGQSNLFLSMKSLESNKSIYSNFATAFERINNDCSREGCRTILLDLRVNLNLIGSRMTGTHYDDSIRMERHLSLPRLLARFSSNFYLENCEFSRVGNGIINYSLFGKKFTTKSGVDQYQMEVSPFASYKRSLTERVYEEYDQQKYLSLGKALVYSLVELLRPKNESLPQYVAEIFDSFHPKADDIDALMLMNFKDDK